MPILKSPAKRMRSDNKKRLTNVDTLTRLKSLSKKLSSLVKEGSKDADAKARELVKKLDQAVSRGIVKKNTASRKKSRIAQLLTKKAKKKSSK